MRICYVVHSRSHFAAPYVDYFARRGHEIHVISFTHELLPNAINHHPVTREYDPTSNKLDYVRAIPAVRRLVRRLAPDLVHAHYLTSNGLVAAATGFHPLVVSARGSDVHQSMPSWLRREILRFVLGRADLVNPVSVELATKVKALGVPAAKVLCISQGIDVSRFPTPTPRPRARTVRMICTRKLHAPYQPATIVEALARLAEAGVDFEFTFAAAGREESRIRELAAARRLGVRIRFLGGYSAAALPGLLADADLYVSAALWDGTSPALLEAMAAGTYPVVSDTPANREWLGGDGDGLLFAPDDVEQLARCLVTASTHQELWGPAAARNRRTVVERADGERNLGVIAEHYDRLVAR